MYKAKTKRMIFSADMYYNLEVIYVAGKEYDIPIEMVSRWERRGGRLVEDTSTIVKPSTVYTPPLATEQKQNEDKTKPVQASNKKFVKR